MSTVKIPEILLPDCADLSKWAVNACDQYTSDPSYWRNVEKITAGSPSAYELVFPEIYLNDKPEERIARINKKMCEYLSGGIFKKITGGFVLVERKTTSGTRTGLVIAVDLEDYSFAPFAKTPVRSTEATILERIPPRVKIRENAPIELPHAMLLYNDPENTVLNCVCLGEVLYDFELMCGGGRVKGTYVTDAERVIGAFQSLLKNSADGLLFAVGDGNHSLATAKTCWEKLKPYLSKEEAVAHPARYALVEAVNIYDSALNFEPIHRAVKVKDEAGFIKGLKTSGGETAYIVSKGRKTPLPFSSDIPEGIRSLDGYISQYLVEHGGEVDYIHGENDLINLTESGFIGILLPSIKKEDFFSLIVKGGNLPKKTFSMGEGYEKRYYVEAKRIKRV